MQLCNEIKLTCIKKITMSYFYQISNIFKEIAEKIHFASLRATEGSKAISKKRQLKRCRTIMEK